MVMIVRGRLVLGLVAFVAAALFAVPGLAWADSIEGHVFHDGDLDGIWTWTPEPDPLDPLPPPPRDYPVAGEAVQIIRFEAPPGEAFEDIRFTDEDGYYRFEGLVPGAVYQITMPFISPYTIWSTTVIYDPPGSPPPPHVPVIPEGPPGVVPGAPVPTTVDFPMGAIPHSWQSCGHRDARGGGLPAW